MKRPSKPALPTVCRELPAFAADDLDAVRQAFRRATPCALCQAWLKKTEADFAPAVVRAGWRGESLRLFAELEDRDIFTRVTAHNQRFWELGDTFEIFLRPVEQQAYVEFHVSPNNRRLQLRFTDAGMVDRLRKTDSIEEALIWGKSFHSRTWLQPDEHRWFVVAEIPVKSVCEQRRPLKGALWRYSFSRYDYTRGREKPVISSTSHHAKPDFHGQGEWGTLSFR